MQSIFPFESMLVFGFISVMLLIGIVLRAKIPLIQKFLFPSCLVGGILGMVLVNLGLIKIEADRLETFAYHLFNLSFISIGLTRSEKSKPDAAAGKEYFKGPLWMALVQGISFPLQAMIGGIFVWIFAFSGMEIFKTFGFLAPLGFNEGPGQALSFGKVWEGAGFEHAVTIGLTFAALGFFFAFFAGVPLANWGIKKGLSAYGGKELPRDLLTGITAKGQKCEPAGELTLHSANVETLAFQAALVGLVYLIAYFLVGSLAAMFEPDVAKALWGFVFIFGLGIALVLKWLLEKAGVDYLIDPGLQRRITGWSVDFLIVSTVAAIQLLVVWKYLLPVACISLSIGILTALVILFLGRRIWSYNLERILAIFGTVTGTVSSGLLLLRIVDPEFKTPVAMELAVMNIFAIPLIFVCLLLVNAPLWWGWSLGLTLFAFSGILLASLTTIRLLKFWGSPKF